MTSAASVVLAAAPSVPSEPPVLNDETVSPGLAGFGVVVLLGVATWLLIRSMNARIKRIDFQDRPISSAGRRDMPDAAGRIQPGSPADEDSAGSSGQAQPGGGRPADRSS